jgi:hypothetical protein
MNDTTDCLFLGGPRDGLTLDIPDSVNALVAISAEEAEVASGAGATNEELHAGFGYRRVGETNVFAHASLNDEQVEAIIAHECEPDEDEECDCPGARLFAVREMLVAALALSSPDSEATPLIFDAIGELNDIL